jgi:hypothetical protein
MIEENEITDVELKIDIMPETTLGAPDLSQFIDDDEGDIVLDEKSQAVAKAQKGLKPSFALKKFMPPLFGMIANAKGEHWLLEKEEVDEFADAFDECMAYYYPDMEGLPPWLLLALSGGMIIGPRVMFDGLTPEQKVHVKKAMIEADKEEANGKTTQDS